MYCVLWNWLHHAVIREQAKLEGLKTHACILRETAFMRVDRSLFHRLRAPLLSVVICAV